VKQQFKENKYHLQLANPIQEVAASGAFSILEHKANSYTVKINDGFTSNDVLQYFMQHQGTIAAFNEILPSLNDIFIQLVDGTKSVTRAFEPVKA
jgi:ABC-2 type transport system ATP-binding protein